MFFTISYIYDPSTNSFTNNLTNNQDALTIPPDTSTVTITVNLLMPTGTPGSIAFNSAVGPLTWVGTVEPPDYQVTSSTATSVTFTFSNTGSTTLLYSFLVNAVYTNPISADPTIVNEGTGQ